MLRIEIMLTVTDEVLSRKGQEEEQHPSPPEGHEQPTSEVEGGSSPIHTVAIQPSAEEQQWRSEQKQFWEEQIKAAKQINRITAVASGVAFLSLLAIGGTLCVTREAADAAKIQAVATSQQVGLLIRTTRARLTATRMEPLSEIVPNTMPYFRVFVKNIGGSPAFRVQWRGTPTECAPAEESACFNSLHTPDTLNDPMPLGDIPSGEGEAFPFIVSAQQPLGLHEVDSQIVVYGILEYDDIFSLADESTFALTRPPKWKKQFCFFYLPQQLEGNRIRPCSYTQPIGHKE